MSQVREVPGSHCFSAQCFLFHVQEETAQFVIIQELVIGSTGFFKTWACFWPMSTRRMTENEQQQEHIPLAPQAICKCTETTNGILAGHRFMRPLSIMQFSCPTMLLLNTKSPSCLSLMNCGCLTLGKGIACHRIYNLILICCRQSFNSSSIHHMNGDYIGNRRCLIVLSLIP